MKCLIDRSLILILVLFSSCGYQAGRGGIIDRYETLSIPYVAEDQEGEFTRQLIRSVSTTSPLTYVEEGGDLILSVKLAEIDEENVGFRYDRNKKGKLIHYIIPTETRLIGMAEVSLIDACTGSPVSGPWLFEAWYDFDHDYTSPMNAVNIFSLGQLSDYDEAYDAALKPLYSKLADKIATYISDIW